MHPRSGTEKLLAILLVTASLMTGIVSPVYLGAQESSGDESPGGISNAAAGDTGDQVRPREPEIELPTVVLEYEAIRREELDVVLPDQDFIELPQFSEQLPEAEQMGIESSAFSGRSPVQPEAEERETADFFSEGIIGGGSDNHLIGDIALYKRGEMPIYQFRFSHEGIDGYGNNAPGEGFFDRTEELSGSFETGSGRQQVRLSMDYLEQETGLQDFDGPISVIHRFLHGTAGYVYDPDSLLYFSVQFEGHSGSQYRGGEDQEREIFLDSEAALGIEGEKFLFGGKTGYSFQEAPGGAELQQLGFELQTAYYGRRFDLNAEGGIHWDEENQFMFPWMVRLEGAMGERGQYRLEGGYRIEDVLYRLLWDSYPLLDTAEGLDLLSGWNASIFLGFNISSRMRWTGGAEWRLATGIPVPDDLDAADPLTGLFPFRLEGAEELYAHMDMDLSIGRNTGLKAGWNSIFSSVEKLDPLHSLNAGLVFDNSESGFGAGLSGEYRIEPSDSLPLIDAYLQYRISKGIQLVLEGKDFFAPFYEEGRPWWGDYESRGMNITLKTEISL